MNNPIRSFNNHIKALQGSFTEDYSRLEEKIEIFECPICSRKFSPRECEVLRKEPKYVLFCPKCDTKLQQTDFGFEEYEDLDEAATKTFTITFFHDDDTYSGIINANNAEEAREKFAKYCPSCKLDRVLKGRLGEYPYISATFEYDMGWKDDLEESLELSSYAEKAWKLNLIISAMNDESAYFGGWLYIWPDGETKEDCEEDFGEKESYEELYDTFKRVYTRYHKSGLYTDSKLVLDCAHEMDQELGLPEIKNFYTKELTEAEKTDPIKLSGDMLVDPDKVDFKKVIQDRNKQIDLDNAEAEKQAKKQALRDKYGFILDTLPDDTREAVIYLFDKLVPANGKCDSLGGELIRALNRLLYRDFNDGDKFYSGYGIETCGSCAMFLEEYTDKEICDLIESMIENATTISDDAYTEKLWEIARAVVNYICENPEVLEETQFEDCLKLDTESLVERQPKSEFECDIPSDLQKYIDNDCISYEDVYYTLSDWADNCGLDINKLARDCFVVTGPIDDVAEFEYSYSSNMQSYINDLESEYGDPDELDDELNESWEDDHICKDLSLPEVEELIRIFPSSQSSFEEGQVIKDGNLFSGKYGSWYVESTYSALREAGYKFLKDDSMDPTYSLQSNGEWVVMPIATSRADIKIFPVSEYDGKIEYDLEESYGGAYDIDENSYFTRDELNDFSDQVVDSLSADSYAGRFTWAESYITNGLLEITVDGFIDDNECEFTVNRLIDMRKIRKPSDLNKYLPEVVKEFKEKFAEEGFDFGPHVSGQDYPLDEELHPAFKKDIKNAYKAWDAKRDAIIAKRNELKDLLTDPEFPIDKEKLAAKLDRICKMPDQFKYVFADNIEKEKYPFYVTYYVEYPIYEPAEGGYYYGGRDVAASTGCKTYDEAAEIAKQEADDASTYFDGQIIKIKDGYRLKNSRGYIGEDEYILIEPEKSYMSYTSGYEPYQ